MTQNYTGMRKGISLVEMVIAIVLFAALAAIGLKYTKVYLNTDMQAKKARVAALTDQGGQLLQAFQIYKTETGMNPASMDDLNGSSAILTAIPANITEMSSRGWQYAADHNGTGLPAFFVDIDLNTSIDTVSQQKVAAEYCALFNREFNTSTSLNVTSTTMFPSASIGTITAAKTAYGVNTFCWSKDANSTQIVIFVP